MRALIGKDSSCSLLSEQLKTHTHTRTETRNNNTKTEEQKMNINKNTKENLQMERKQKIKIGILTDECAVWTVHSYSYITSSVTGAHNTYDSIIKI